MHVLSKFRGNWKQHRTENWDTSSLANTGPSSKTAVAWIQLTSTLLAKVATEDLELRQFHVKTAFLNGDLEEEIYMKPPEGLNIETHKVCRLIKSLYGLRQAPRAWHIKLKEELAGMNFTPSEADPAFFIYRADDIVTLLDEMCDLHAW